MKLSIRCLILGIIMSIVSLLMYSGVINVVVPWILSKNDDTVLSLSLIGIVFGGIVIWTGICEFFAKLLKCDELIDRFIKK